MRDTDDVNANDSRAAARLTHVRNQAIATFEDPAKAERWLRRPLTELGNKAPIDLALTEDGARLVENISRQDRLGCRLMKKAADAPARRF